MKKFLTLFVSLMLLLGCVGCGTFTPPEITPEPPKDNTSTPTEPGDDEPTGGDEEQIVFTVTLLYNGRAFFPSEPVNVLWTGNDGVYTAPVGSNGVASYTGLDGDYRVTLDKLPHGYTYDCNNHYADNDHPSIRLNVLKIEREYSYKQPNGMYQKDGCFVLGEGGKTLNKTYRVELDSSSRKLYFEFTPNEMGVYSIESWVDITANEINPYVEKYNGTFASKYFDTVQNDGGSSSTYTKNFRFLYTIMSQSYVGNSMTFAIYAESQGDYPITVDFTLKYEREPDRVSEYAYPVTAVGPFAPYASSIPAGSSWHYIYEDVPNHVLDGSNLELMEDGYYHRVRRNAAGAVEQDLGILFVKLTKNSEIVVGDGDPPADVGFLESMISLDNIFLKDPATGETRRYDYTEFIRTTYKNWIDANDPTGGTCPMTEELRTFMQGFAIASSYFYDGDGHAESCGINSSEENQWLFNCGYYE